MHHPTPSATRAPDDLPALARSATASGRGAAPGAFARLELQPTPGRERLPGWRGGWWVAPENRGGGPLLGLALSRGLALGLALGLAGCSGGDAPGPGGSDPSADGPVHLLLVTVDTLRADRTSAYGYRRDTTPNLSALAEEGVRFERAYSSAPFTAPSHASLFTGQVTQTHGVLTWGVPLASGSLTLAEIAAEQGYATAAFYNHPSLETCDVLRGFEVQRPEVFGPWQDTLANFEAWLDGRAGVDDRPTCTWIHLWDVHRPYGYRNWYWFQEQTGRSGADLELSFAESGYGPEHDPRIGRREEHYNVREARRAAPLPLGGELADNQQPQGSRVFDERDWRSIADRYDNGVRYVDDGLGALVDLLEERDLLDDTLLVITADHGETLTERPEVWFTHDPYLYEETLRVPLILRLPGGAHAGRVVEGGLARSIDILPTFLDWAGLEDPAGIQGRSLRPWIEGRDSDPARPVLAQTQTRHAKERQQSLPAGATGWLEHRIAFVEGDRKLIEHLDLNGEPVRRELYDLGADPAERADLAARPEHAAEVAELARSLELLRGALPIAGSALAEMTCEECLNLQRMGYVEDCSAYCND
jgi:arylsulfatase A-like enzyme